MMAPCIIHYFGINCITLGSPFWHYKYNESEFYKFAVTLVAERARGQSGHFGGGGGLQGAPFAITQTHCSYGIPPPPGLQNERTSPTPRLQVLHVISHWCLSGQPPPIVAR